METIDPDANSLVSSTRIMSIAAGQLFPMQIASLKAIPLVVFGEALKNEVNVDFDAKSVIFTLTGTSNFPVAETEVRLGYLIQYVHQLIGKFEVSVFLNGRNIDGQVSKARKPRTNRKRKKGLRKVRK
jgi:hypothetical protein